MAKLVEAPIPVVAAAVVPQFVSPEQWPEGPGWLAAFLMGVWVILWALDKMGRLPFKGDRADAKLVIELPAEHVDRVKAIHGVVTREHPDKPGFFLVWDGSGKLEKALLDSLERQERLVAATVATLEAVQASLRGLHQKVDELSEHRRSA